MHDPIIEVASVSKSFGANRVLETVEFAVKTGEIVGLLGPNGCGKSTLLNVVTGFARADAGSVAFAGQNITRASVSRIARRGLVRTFQLPSMPHRMTVTQVLRAGAAGEAGLISVLRRDDAEQAEVEALLRDLALDKVRDLPAGSLSGGQKKLLSIALALRAKPRVICLDEPTAGVHPNLRADMVRLLRSVNQAGITLLIIEHDMHFIRELCGRCIVLDRGSVIANCRPADLTTNSRVVEAYLGKARDKGAQA